MFTKNQVHEVIFEADTKAGKHFDVWLIVFILLSVMGVMLSSVASIDEQYGYILTTTTDPRRRRCDALE